LPSKSTNRLIPGAVPVPVQSMSRTPVLASGNAAAVPNDTFAWLELSTVHTWRPVSTHS
jgi:hypothetical protein